MHDYVFVVGDLNARTGEEIGAAEMVGTADGIERESQDKVINEEGKNLIRLCKEMRMSILNGRIKGDMRGKITFIGGKNEHTRSDYTWF